MSSSGGSQDNAMHVMVLSTDRRFRDVVSLLLERRGCAVSRGEGEGTLAQRIDRERTDVVILDAAPSLAAAARTKAAVESLGRRVGVVVVADDTQNKLLKLQAFPKWGSFDRLFEALMQCNRQRRPSQPFEQTADRAGV